MGTVSLIISLGIAALLAIIPANIAKNKGRSFGLWWFFGWMAFIIALPASLIITDQSGAAQNYYPQNAATNTPVTNTNAVNAAGNSDNQAKGSTDNIDHLVKYKDLLDAGIITREEFEAKKKDLLGL